MRNFILGCLVGVGLGILLSEFVAPKLMVSNAVLVERKPANTKEMTRSAPLDLMADGDRRKLTLQDLKIPTSAEIRRRCPDHQIYSLLRNRCDTLENVNRDMADIAEQIPGLEDDFKLK